jgi:hypothetical protein
MDSGKDFVGFHEAPIHFAPTFKYDVLRSLKSSNSKRLKLHRWKSQGGQERARQLTEVQEGEREDGSEDDSDAEEGEVEAESIASTYTSMNSRTVAYNDQDDDEFFSSSNHLIPGASKLSLSTAVVKVKSKLLAVMSPSSPSSPVGRFRLSDQSLAHSSPPRKPKKHKHSISLDATPNPEPNHSTGELLVERKKMKQARTRSLRDPSLKAKSMEELATTNPNLLKPLPAPPMERALSTETTVINSDEENSDPETDKGVYDSSSKRRVPSWLV